jgi:hypothetical protein
MNNSKQFALQPMSPVETRLIEKVYRTCRGLFIFFSVFQMVWTGMAAFGIIYNVLALIICGGIFFLMYFLIIVYYLRLNKTLRMDTLERMKMIVIGTVVSKRSKPARIHRFYFIRVNDINYRVPRWYYENTEIGGIAEFPVSKNAGIVLLEPNRN